MASALQPAPDNTRTELIPKYRVEVVHANGTAPALITAPPPQLAALQAAQALARLDAAASGACAPAEAQPSGCHIVCTAAAATIFTSSCECAVVAGYLCIWIQPMLDPCAGFGPQNPVMARLAENRRLTAPGHFQEVRHLSFDLQQSGLQYEPGDALAIVPRQPDAAVDAFLERVGLSRDAHVLVGPSETQANGSRRHSFQVSQTGAFTSEIGFNDCCTAGDSRDHSSVHYAGCRTRPGGWCT